MSSKNKISFFFIQDLLKKFMNLKIDTNDFTAEVNKELLLINLLADDIAIVKQLEKDKIFLEKKLNNTLSKLNKVKNRNNYLLRAIEINKAKIDVYNTSNEVINSYRNLKVAAKDLKLHTRTISKALCLDDKIVYCKKLDKNIHFKWG
jgi:hypothetical protein